MFFLFILLYLSGAFVLAHIPVFFYHWGLIDLRWGIGFVSFFVGIVFIAPLMVAIYVKKLGRPNFYHILIFITFAWGLYDSIVNTNINVEQDGCHLIIGLILGILPFLYAGHPDLWENVFNLEQSK